MQLSGPIVEIVERAYDVDAGTPEWLESFRSAAERSFSGHVAAQAYTFQIRSDGTVRLLDSIGAESWEPGFRRFHARARPAAIRQFYLKGPVRSLWTALANPKDEPAYIEQANEHGSYDVWAALGLDPGGSGVGLAFIERGISRHLPRSTRQALKRIAAHLGSAQRLRSSLGDGATKADILNGADAVLAPDGAVLHAERDARAAEARLSLRDAARRMDRARLRSQRTDPEASLGLWRALVDGRWSLVERFESDGRRILVARRNDPTTRPNTALTELERKVVALVALGHSLKYCAYELGRSNSAVYNALASATRKLGVDSRAALVELHGAIVGSDDAASHFDAGERAPEAKA